MKKKRWMIPVGIIAAFVLLCAVGLWYMASNTLGFSVGRCLIADNGSYMLIRDKSPIVMSNVKGNESLFSDLETGDKILVLHNGIDESYPGRTGAYWCMKLDDGTEADISQEVLSTLSEMGYLNTEGGSEPSNGTEDNLTENNIPGLVGVSHTTATAAYQDDWGVKLTVKDVTPTGLTIVCQQQDGEPTGELNTGSDYSLDVLVDGEWINVELLPEVGELAWTSEAWFISMNDTTKWEVNWERLYGSLDAGSYRISKSIMDFRGTGDYDSKLYYAGFEILSADAGTEIICEQDGIGVSLPYVTGWEYEIVDYAEEGMSYGVNYRPAGEEGWINFHYWRSFGVCGTGLETEPYGSGTMGTYDNSAIWSYIAYPADNGHFVATTNGVADWWNQYGDMAMEILDRARCIVTIVD